MSNLTYHYSSSYSFQITTESKFIEGEEDRWATNVTFMDELHPGDLREASKDIKKTLGEIIVLMDKADLINLNIHCLTGDNVNSE